MAGGEMNFDLVIGVQVEADVPTGGDLQMHETPAGHAATTAYFGDYSGLHAAHAAVQEWCQANGRDFGRTGRSMAIGRTTQQSAARTCSTSSSPTFC